MATIRCFKACRYQPFVRAPCPAQPCRSPHGNGRCVPRCQAQNSRGPEEPEDGQEQIVLSNWNMPEFWHDLTWDASVPATFAVALHWVLTDSLIISELPTADAAYTILACMLPCVALDCLLWLPSAFSAPDAAASEATKGRPSSPPCFSSGPSLLQSEQEGQLQGVANTLQMHEGWTARTDGSGMEGRAAQAARALYSKLQRSAEGYREHHRQAVDEPTLKLPAVQKNVSRMARCLSQQVVLQGVGSTALVSLLQEVDRNFPGALPRISGLPGLPYVDPAIAGGFVMAAIFGGMATHSLLRAAHTLQSDYLERCTIIHLASMGQAPAPTPGLLGRLLQRKGRDKEYPGRRRLEAWEQLGQGVAALVALRQTMFVVTCSFVFLQTDSILASAWLAYIVSNAERRLVLTTQGLSVSS